MVKKKLKEYLIPKTSSNLGDVVFGPLKSFEWRGKEVWYQHGFLKTPHGYDYTLVIGFKIGDSYLKSKSKHILVGILDAEEKKAIEPYVRSKFNGRDVQFFA